MLDYKEIMIAQQRCEDMRREVMDANRHRILMGSAQSGLMQWLVKAMTSMKQRMVRTGAQAQVAGMMPSRTA